ncbi:MAG TPA: ELWxxDGT repeat protein, partial [Thermoanaerobaculia bacterium]|nr:ELWxxDGT repeat protein [Thermoanaerobaculia bacterium]
FFVGDNLGAGGASIWTSDGTPQGTVQRFALPSTVGLIYSLSVIGSDFFFADDHEAWRSDGTTAGTVQLSHFGIPTPVLLDPQFVRLGATTYFIGWNDESSLTQLWQTDGTPAGTSEVHLGGGAFTDPSDLRIAGGALYFLADSPDGTGTSLWRTDGTTAGTTMLGEFRGTVVNPNRPGGLTPLGSGFAFHADDGVHGVELWATDGTPAGTRLVKDVQQGSGGSEPHDLAAAGGRVFFAADDGIHGNELWESDGTAAGTRIVQDINPGPDPSNPSGMAAAGGLLYFSANDGLTGQELWALPLAGPSGCQPSATALCLSRGRFEVKAFWRDFQGGSGAGQTLPLTSDTGTFWFFSPDNLEVIVKVIDGRALNGYFWVFYGALSSVEYALTVTDTVTGLAQRYFNPLGDLSSAGDTTAFGPLSATAIGAGGAAGKSGTPGTPEPHRAGAITPPPAPAAAVPAAAAQASGTCQASALQLCLNGGRFAVQASWTDFSGNSGAGMAVPLTDETGYFWFFAAGNVETVLKVVDGRSLNNHFWVFYGALSNVQYTLTVTDTVTGAVKTYTNPAGQFASVADTAAF